MKKPDIIIIMTDDQGYGDLSCMGSEQVITPNIDRLAASGVLFSCMYSGSPVCSPSRACLLTGRYPANAGVRAILGGHRTASGLTPEAPTIASALKNIGYRTAAVGKWHLGLAQQSRPLQNGFDSFYGFMAGCIDYYSHIFYHGMADGKTHPTHDLWQDGDEVYNDGKYFTELVTEKSVDFIEKCDDAEPFLLYIGYNAPHYPMHAPEKYKKRFSHLPWDRQIMAAMISAVDDGVGDITDALRRKNRLENTVIYFQSDNGPSREARNWLDGRPDPYYGGSAGLLKGHKFSLFDGGIRVPAIISCPALIPAGQVVDIPAHASDIFPTLLNMAGGDAGAYETDGCDIMPVLQHGGQNPHKLMFWEMDGQTAVRSGKYKLVLNGVLCEGEPAQDEVFLSDMEKDPSERVNLSQTLPDITSSLREAALEWRGVIERSWSNKWALNYKV